MMHAVRFFIARVPFTRCGIYVSSDKATALGKVTCKNCLRTRNF